jgi:metal-responsive CopG/Arc/MetJ family transcriptional regulator
MADTPVPMVAVNLPADLVAKLDEMKHYREEDRGKTVEEIVRELCQSYVDVREMARWELAHAEDLNRSYEEKPNDWDDSEVWKAASQRREGRP